MPVKPDRPDKNKPNPLKLPAYNAAVHRPELKKVGLEAQYKEYWREFKKKGYLATAAAEAAWAKIWPLYCARKPEEVMRNKKVVNPYRMKKLLNGKTASPEQELAWAIEAVGMQAAGVPVDFYTAPSWKAIGLWKMALRDESKLFRKMEELAEADVVDDGGNLGELEEILKKFDDDNDQEAKRPEGPEAKPPVSPGPATGSAA